MSFILTNKQAHRAFNALSSMASIGDFVKELDLSESPEERVLLNQTPEGSILITKLVYATLELTQEDHASVADFATAYSVE